MTQNLQPTIAKLEEILPALLVILTELLNNVDFFLPHRTNKTAQKRGLDETVGARPTTQHDAGPLEDACAEGMAAHRRDVT